MKIALVNPPNLKLQYEDSGYKCVHLGIGYIAAELEKNGFEVDIYECNLYDICFDKLINNLLENDYFMVGITTYYFNIMQTYRILRKVKSNNKNIITFVGGIYASMNYADILKNSFVDFCSIGEGEKNVVELAKCIANGLDIKNVDGIAFKNCGEIEIHKNKTFIDNLDELYFPKRVYYYKNSISSIIASRGCNGNCSFCGIINYYSKFTTRNIRIRTPKNVVDEIEILVRNNNVKYIYFQDENIFVTLLKDEFWIQDFCNEISRRNLHFKFYAYARADNIIENKKELDLLKQAGLDCMFVGIESFTERQLRLYEKRISINTNFEVLQIIRNLDIKINIGFILFDPYLTLEEYKQNIMFLNKSRFYEFAFFSQSPISCLDPMYPMPNTKFYNLISNEKIFDQTVFFKYHFYNTEVESLFYKLTPWKNIVRNKYVEIDKEYEKIPFDDKDKEKDCLDKLRTLLKIDIMYLNSIVEDNKVVSENKCKHLFDYYSKKIVEI